MAKITHETIKTLIELSRIRCKPEEEEQLFQNLQGILSYIENLNEVNTDNVKPCNIVLEGLQSVLREDEVKETLPRETFLANAPSHTGGMIRVPPVIKQH